MTESYHYLASPDYISNLTFEYLETYSLQRNEAYLNQIHTLKKEFQYLKRRMDSGRDCSLVTKGRVEYLAKQVHVLQLITNEDGWLHSSSEHTCTFGKNDLIAKQIQHILLKPINEVPMAMCGPVFRDAIVFRDINGAIVSALNICLSCDYMMVNKHTYVNADSTVYLMLKELFISLGHPVEKETYL